MLAIGDPADWMTSTNSFKPWVPIPISATNEIISPKTFHDVKQEGFKAVKIVFLKHEQASTICYYANVKISPGFTAIDLRENQQRGGQWICIELSENYSLTLDMVKMSGLFDADSSKCLAIFPDCKVMDYDQDLFEQVRDRGYIKCGWTRQLRPSSSGGYSWWV